MTSDVMPITAQNKIHRHTARHYLTAKKNPKTQPKTKKTKEIGQKKLQSCNYFVKSDWNQNIAVPVVFGTFLNLIF